jgi:hypothetical protein
MSTDKAEAVLMNAIGRYVAENPDRKEEVLEALELLLNKTAMAASIATECGKALQECLEIMSACPIISAIRTS